MSLYIPGMSDEFGSFVQGLANNFQTLDGSQIVEWGSNENGTYARWDNGLQICWFNHQFGNDSAGTLNYSRPWPASFVDAPVVTTHVRAALSGNPSPEAFNAGDGPTATDTGNIRIVDSGTYTRLYVISIGRWK